MISAILKLTDPNLRHVIGRDGPVYLGRDGPVYLTDPDLRHVIGRDGPVYLTDPNRRPVIGRNDPVYQYTNYQQPQFITISAILLRLLF